MLMSSGLMAGTLGERAETVFTVYDVDGDGFLRRYDVVCGLSDLGLLQGQSTKKLGQLFTKMLAKYGLTDSDFNAMISIQQFCTLAEYVQKQVLKGDYAEDYRTGQAYTSYPALDNQAAEYLRKVFLSYCLYDDQNTDNAPVFGQAGQQRNGKQSNDEVYRLTAGQFMKLVMDTMLVAPSGPLPAMVVDIIFAKVKPKNGRRLAFPDFTKAVAALATETEHDLVFMTKKMKSYKVPLEKLQELAKQQGMGKAPLQAQNSLHMISGANYSQGGNYSQERISPSASMGRESGHGMDYADESLPPLMSMASDRASDPQAARAARAVMRHQVSLMRNGVASSIPASFSEPIPSQDRLAPTPPDMKTRLGAALEMEVNRLEARVKELEEQLEKNKALVKFEAAKWETLLKEKDDVIEDFKAETQRANTRAHVHEARVKELQAQVRRLEDANSALTAQLNNAKAANPNLGFYNNAVAASLDSNANPYQKSNSFFKAGLPSQAAHK